MVVLRVPLDFLFTRISQRNMVVRTPTNIIRLVANFVSHGKTTFYHILPPSYHLSSLPNIFSCERRRRLQIKRGCLSYRGEKLFLEKVLRWKIR